jgi:ribosome-binding protein aMBF1 (putative translation factor)
MEETTLHPIERGRRARGWSRAELASRVGVRVNTVRDWERGAMPRGKNLRALARAFGVDLLQLADEILAWRQAQSRCRS